MKVSLLVSVVAVAASQDVVAGDHFVDAGVGWCLDTHHDRIPWPPSLQSASVRADGSAQKCEDDCCHEGPECLGYITEDGSKCMLVTKSDTSSNGNPAREILWHDSEVRNHCWKKKPGWSRKCGPAPTPPPNYPVLGHCNGITSSAWPVFNNRQELLADHAWASYFDIVYGTVPSSGYPICIASFSHLYKPHLETAGVTLPPLSDDCPSKPGEFYSTMTDHQDEWSLWIWNPALAQPSTIGSLPANTWVEVIHQSYFMDGSATWLYYTPGTAMWMNLGNTRAYNDHDNAVTALLKEPCQGGGGWNANDHECIPQFPRLYAAARAANIHSIQFKYHSDMPCGKNHIRKNMAIEIVDLGYEEEPNSGTTTCEGKTFIYHAGWEAATHCICNDYYPTLNCHGYGILGKPSSDVEVV